MHTFYCLYAWCLYVDMSVSLFRAYRIGQCRDVTVLRLISLGTVEEIIYLRQVYKQVTRKLFYLYKHNAQIMLMLVSCDYLLYYLSDAAAFLDDI